MWLPTHLVGVAVCDLWHSTMVPHVMELIGRDEAVVGDAPDRRLDVERVTASKAHKLWVAWHPVVGSTLRRTEKRARESLEGCGMSTCITVRRIQFGTRVDPTLLLL